MSTLTAAPTRFATLVAPPLAAVQFLTRIPVPAFWFDDRTLPRAVGWFPLAGTGLGWLAAWGHHLLAPHLSRTVAGVLGVALLVAITGALHEDALADCADAFGLRRTRERTLAILHDPAVGSFGVAAVCLSLVARAGLIAALPLDRVTPVLVAALTLSRWAALPLALLPSATPANGRGSLIARQVSALTLGWGSACATAVVVFVLHAAAVVPVLAAFAIVALTAAFYHHRLGGTTGDCFGATIQLVEIAVLCCGAWHP